MSPSIVFFCTRGTGHFNRMRPIIRGLAARGARIHVFTLSAFAAEAVADGARFVDVFGKCSADELDTTSVPLPCRGVTFAGTHAGVIAADVARLRPSLIVYDTFSVLGFVVARILGLPHVNVCAGHNVAPKRFLAALEKDPRVALTPECSRAVEALRDHYGIEEASPFLYIATQSRFLNVYCEPPEFLPEEDRAPFEPLEFFGSLSGTESPRNPGDVRYFADEPGWLNLYVSFGTVVWGSFTADALAATRAFVEALSVLGGVRAVVSTGRAALSPELRAGLRRHNVRIFDYVRQQDILQEADLFVTHHGLNSTHEAIWNRVPMISRPFFWDQPALAARSAALGIAVPIDGGPRGPLTTESIHAAVQTAMVRRDAMRENLEQARQWEVAVIERRGAVLDRILSLA